jgi:hypothetical protein
MPKKPVAVLSLGILIVILAVSVTISVVTELVVGVSEIFSLTLVLFGLWIIVLAGIRTVNPEEFGAGAFNTFSGGILLTTLGIVWLLYGKLPIEYLLMVLLLVVGILVVVVGIRAWRK